MKRDGGCVWAVCATAERGDALRRFAWPRRTVRRVRVVKCALRFRAAPSGLLDEVEAEVGEE